MNEQQKAELLERLIENPPHRDRLLVGTETTAEEQAELLALASAADAVRVANVPVPPLEEDPIAAMLGVAPSPGLALDPAQFKAARVRSNVSVTHLRDYLVSRGWDVTGPQIASWQSRSGIELSPAMLEDIGAALSASPDAFTVRHAETTPTLFATLRATDWFETFVEQWRHMRNVARSVAEAQLLSRAAATVHRGEEPDVDQVRELLAHLVSPDGDDRNPAP
ncbi:hypothetical protein [Microbacterium aerolatum]|uniref:hypothetical protein n=1 Tax=Microbacterium aerolatum TaxID=153731 RepID=UPI00384D7F21